MSDLRVTDVQAALRHHATILGHDVTTNPRAVRLTPHPGSSREEPSEHGLVIGHNLLINWGNHDGDGYLDYKSHLNSYIMQSERPLISGIHSNFAVVKKPGGAIREVGSEVHSRNVTFKVPQIIKHVNDVNPEEHSFEETYFKRNYGFGTAFTADRGHKAGAFPNLTRLHASPDFHPDIFHALESHKGKDIEDRGIHYQYRATDGPIKRDMTSEDMSAFNFKGALQHLTTLATPFSNLIVVGHLNHTGPVYTYNHETEELHRHERP